MEGATMRIFHKGIVHPWSCDVMGHLTTRHYMSVFDEASFQMLSEYTGWLPNSPDWAGKGWADVRHEIEYLKELRVGTVFDVRGKVTDVGRTSLTAPYELRTKPDDDLAATMKATTVFFDLAKRTSLSISDEMRQRILSVE